jgi:membrane-associated protease RseP (regulator of RpoE activity)
LTLTHEGLPDEDALQQYQREWERGLDKLQLHAETGALPDVVNRVIVGIRPAPVGAAQAQALGLAEGAATLVTGLVPGFSAEKAGILEGDIITALDGQETTAQRPMNVLTQGRKPGDQIAVTFYRDGVQHTLNMELKGYPVPEIPPTFAALADFIEQEYAQISAELDELFSGVSAEQARKRPAESEWSADHVLAHLIYSERYAHEELGGRITNRAPQHWSGNDDTRLDAMLTIYPNHEALLAEFKSRMRETVVILRNFPEAAVSPVTLWGSAFSMDGWLQHTRGHYLQIRAALA